ncbi:MAG: PIN domain-containing protein [Rectinemataceae bacterium]
MTLVLDTNAYSAFRRDDQAAIDLLEEADELIVPTIVVGELLAGFLGGNRWEANWAGLLEFLGQPGVRLHQLGLKEAEKYGMLVRNLRATGSPLPTNDLWIAATALALGAAVATRDAHFGTISGLFVVSW